VHLVHRSDNAQRVTGHEMLDAVNLVHMNGRASDPVIRVELACSYAVFRLSVSSMAVRSDRERKEAALVQPLLVHHYGVPSTGRAGMRHRAARGDS
jgi:hypothetical protein